MTKTFICTFYFSSILKLTALFFFVCMFSFNSYAQKNKDMGVLKLKSGDSLNVTFKDLGNYKGVNYRKKNTGKTYFVEADKIEYYQVGNRTFVSKKIKPSLYAMKPLAINESKGYGPTSESYLVIDSSRIIKEGNHLVEILKKGKSSLYKLNKYEGYDEFFLETDSGEIVEIPLDYYNIGVSGLTSVQIQNGDPNNIYSNIQYKIERSFSYISVLKEKLGDHPKFTTLPNYKFSEENLIYLVGLYNGEPEDEIVSKRGSRKPKSRPAVGLIYSPVTKTLVKDKITKNSTPNFGITAFMYKPIHQNGKNIYFKYGVSQLFLQKEDDKPLSYSLLFLGTDHYMDFKKTSLFLGWNVGLARYDTEKLKGFQLPIGIELGVGYELNNSRIRLSAGFSSLFKRMAIVSYNPVSLSFIF